MAKSEGRGWKRFVPSGPTIVKVFVSLVAIKFATTVVGKYVPPSVQPYLPNVT
jgi:hypothetical protein